MRKNIIGVVGGGNMGEALIKGLVKRALFCPSGILVCEADTKRRKYLKEKYRVGIGDLNAVIGQSSTVILAVKPQDMENVLSQIRGHHKLFISVAAGLTTEFFEKRLGPKARVVRAMPNMPALIGEGMTAICKGRFATLSDVREAIRLLASIGEVLEVQEKHMDAITAVSGSGPAYVFLFVEQWIAAAKSLGLSQSDAKRFVYKTLAGSAHLLLKAGSTASDLRAKVTSKGGTTQAAMEVFFKNNTFGKLMKAALSAARKRAKQLAK